MLYNCSPQNVFSSDSVASHLHTHKSHTHRQYNDEFMIRAPDRWTDRFNRDWKKSVVIFKSWLCFHLFCLELFFATSCRIQPTRSAQQKKRTPPVQSAPPPKRLPPPEPEPKSPPKKSSPSPPLLPPLRQWLSHEDMHLVRKEGTYLLKPEEC